MHPRSLINKQTAYGFNFKETRKTLLQQKVSKPGKWTAWYTHYRQPRVLSRDQKIEGSSSCHWDLDSRMQTTEEQSKSDIPKYLLYRVASKFLSADTVTVGLHLHTSARKRYSRYSTLDIDISIVLRKEAQSTFDHWQSCDFVVTAH